MQQLVHKLTVLLNALQQNFDKLSTRDRRLVLAMAAAVLFMIFYSMLTGSYRFQRSALNYYKEVSENNRWIELNIKEIKAFAGAKAPAVSGASSDVSLISMASTTAKPFGISFKRFQPEGDTGLRLWIESAEFDQLLRWVGVLGKQGVVLGQLDINRTDKSVGLVDARLLIVREP